MSRIVAVFLYCLLCISCSASNSSPSECDKVEKEIKILRQDILDQFTDSDYQDPSQVDIQVKLDQVCAPFVSDNKQGLRDYFEKKLNSLPLDSNFDRNDYSQYKCLEGKEFSALNISIQMSPSSQLHIYSPTQLCRFYMIFWIARTYGPGEEFAKRMTVLNAGLPQLWRIKDDDTNRVILASYGTDRIIMHLEIIEGLYYASRVEWLKKR